MYSLLMHVFIEIHRRSQPYYWEDFRKFPEISPMLNFRKIDKLPTVQHADKLPPKSFTLGLHPIARELLHISRPAEARRLNHGPRYGSHTGGRG